MRRVLVTAAVLSAASVAVAEAQTPVSGLIPDTADPLVEQVGATTVALAAPTAGTLMADRSVAIGRADCDGVRACSVVVTGAAVTATGRTRSLGRWATFVAAGQEAPIAALLSRRAQRALSRGPLTLSLVVRTAPMTIGRPRVAYWEVQLPLAAP